MNVTWCQNICRNFNFIIHFSSYYNKYGENNLQSPQEILQLVCISVLTVFVAVCVDSLYVHNKNRTNYGQLEITPNFLERKSVYFIIEYVAIIIVFVISILYSQYVNFLLVILCMVAFHVALLISSKSLNNSNVDFYNPKRQNFLTNMRSNVFLISGIFMLVIEMPVFSSSYGYVQSFGYSVMDAGIGLQVFLSAIVAPELKREFLPPIKAVKYCLPLLVSGVFKFMLHHNFNQQTFCAGDNGHFWNFFIILALTKITSSIIIYYSGIKYTTKLAVLIIFLHELLLQSGVGDWILTRTPNPNILIITEIREGFVSLFGYVGLYLLSISLGKTFNYRFSIGRIGFDMFRNTVIYFIFIICFESWIGISRRLCNAGYCVWIIFLGNFMGLLFLCVEVFCKKLYKYKLTIRVYSPLVYQAINYNSLVFFWMCNLLNGVLNRFLKPGECQSHIMTLLTYIFINCSFIVVLYVNDIKVLARIRSLQNIKWRPCRRREATKKIQKFS